MKLSILISTIDARIKGVENVLLEKDDRVNYVICHQYTDEVYLQVPEGLNREDVLLVRIPGKGVSRSRNRAIELATGDIALLADDDVRYHKEYLETIFNVYENNPDLDVGCFKINTLEGQPEYKEYPDTCIRIRNFTKYYPSTIEMSFRLNSIRDSGIRLDERFGLGSYFSAGGEERIFLYDCWKKGKIIRFYPEYVVIHTYKDEEYRSRKCRSDIFKKVIGVEIRTRGSSHFLNSLRNPGMLIEKIWNNLLNPFVFIHLLFTSVLFLFRSRRRVQGQNFDGNNSYQNDNSEVEKTSANRERADRETMDNYPVHPL